MEYGVEDQNRALKEAREDGAQAILIDPMNEGALRSYLQNQPSDIPVILLNSRVESEKISSIYTADMRQIGEELGKLIVAQESGTGKKVHAYTSYHEKDKTDVYQLCKAFRGELERAGIPVEIYAGNKINADGGRNIVTAALDSRALLQILNQEKVPKNLYGVGYSNHILEKLAQGEIKAIVMYNEFDMGYLAMEAAVKYIEKDMTDRINILEHYVIYPEDVYREDKETLLFPIS